MGIGGFKRITVDNIEENENLRVISSKFPAQIKRVRAYMRVTQAEFAKKLGVGLSTVRGWEQGRQFPSFENFTAVLGMIEGTALSLELEKAYMEQKGQ